MSGECPLDLPLRFALKVLLLRRTFIGDIDRALEATARPANVPVTWIPTLIPTTPLRCLLLTLSPHNTSRVYRNLRHSYLRRLFAFCIAVLDHCGILSYRYRFFKRLAEEQTTPPRQYRTAKSSFRSTSLPPPRLVQASPARDICQASTPCLETGVGRRAIVLVLRRTICYFLY